jgi:predicted transcriptional regulator
MQRNNIQDKVIFRDLEKQYGFAQISHLVTEDTKLSDLAIRVYLALLKFAMNKNYCFPGQDKLAETLGKSRSSIFRGLNELRNRGLVSWKTRGLNKTNLYVIEPVTEVYAEKLRNLADVSELQQPDVSELTHQGASNLTHKEYKVEEEKIKNNKLTLNDDINISSFSEEAVELAKELNDLKSIKYYQKLISQKNKGIVNSDDVTDSLIFTRTQIRTAQVDGTKPLSNPAGLFVKTLKDLQEKRKRKEQLSKLETMRAKFLEKSKF